MEVCIKESVTKFKFLIISCEFPNFEYSLNFIIDSGSNNCILFAHVYKHCKMCLKEQDNSMTVISVSAQEHNCAIANAEILIGEQSFEIEFLIADGYNAAKNFFEANNEEIHGIIGSDFLSQNKFSIDFCNFKLIA